MFRVRAEQRDGYSGGYVRFTPDGVREVWDDTATVFDTLEDADKWARATAYRTDHLRESGKKALRRSVISLTVMGPLGDMGGYIIESHLDSLH